MANPSLTAIMKCRLSRPVRHSMLFPYSFLVLLYLAATPANTGITKGPYPQNVTVDAVTIMWETDTMDDQSSIVYGMPGSATHKISNIHPALIEEVTCFGCEYEESHIYEVRLQTGLLEDTTYDYTVISASDTATGQFTTASTTSTHFRFAVYGDSRLGSVPDAHTQVLKSMLQHHTASDPISFILHAGDLVGAGLSYASWQTEFFPKAATAIHEIPFYPVLGNHELIGLTDHPLLWYYYFFDLPENGSATDEESWYSFDYGNAHFVCLDTNLTVSDFAGVPLGDHDFRPGSQQDQWLVDDLSAAMSNDDVRHLFVCLHHPPYSSGSHAMPMATEPIDASETNEVLNVRAHLVPLFEQYGVDIVFGGHDHLYERGLRNGITYIVTGGGGAALYPINQVENPYQQYAESVYHYCIVDVSANDLTVKAYRTDGSVLDQLTLISPSSVNHWTLLDTGAQDEESRHLE